MQEFIYYNALGLDFPIREQIFVTTNIEDTKNKNFLISNSKEVDCELTAVVHDQDSFNEDDQDSE